MPEICLREGRMATIECHVYDQFAAPVYSVNPFGLVLIVLLSAFLCWYLWYDRYDRYNKDDSRT